MAGQLSKQVKERPLEAAGLAALTVAALYFGRGKLSEYVTENTIITGAVGKVAVGGEDAILAKAGSESTESVFDLRKCEELKAMLKKAPDDLPFGPIRQRGPFRVDRFPESQPIRQLFEF